jgi:hypothetical protein
MTDQFDWGSLGQSWWEETGEECRASPQQIRFACARHQGSTRSRAAALANYSGDADALRSAGSRADDSKAVQDLLTLASAAEAGTTDNPVTIHEAKIKVGKLVRSIDPTIALKASELFVKLEVAEKSRGESPSDDGFEDWRAERDCLIASNGGSAYLLLTGGRLDHLRLLHDTYFTVMREEHGPELWARFYAALNDSARESLDRFLADPSYQVTARLKIWAEIGRKPPGPVDSTAVDWRVKRGNAEVSVNASP